MPYRKIEDGIGDDTEGQGFRMGVKDGLEDDAEGHVVRPRGVSDGVDTDDTEGNAFRRS